MSDFKEELALAAVRLRVPLRNAKPKDDWFMSNLAYGVDQEIAAATRRLAALVNLRDRYTA